MPAFHGWHLAGNPRGFDFENLRFIADMPARDRSLDSTEYKIKCIPEVRRNNTTREQVFENDSPEEFVNKSRTGDY